MSKRVTLYCFNCDTECGVMVNEEDERLKLGELFCPFCGELIEVDEDDDGPTEDDE